MSLVDRLEMWAAGSLGDFLALSLPSSEATSPICMNGDDEAVQTVAIECSVLTS